MKKIYEAPIMEAIRFTNESIITASGNGALLGKGGMSSTLINGQEGVNTINF